MFIEACRRLGSPAALIWLVAAGHAAGLAAQEPRKESGTAPGTEGGRLLRASDLFASERIGDVAVSPGGEYVVYTRQRPFDWDGAGGADGSRNRTASRANHRKDVWIASLRDGTSYNLTDGARDGSGFWRPVWSPDGERIAMLSTRGGGAERLWVWEKSSGALSPLSERAVVDDEFAWVDAEHVAAVMAVEREPPPFFPGTGDSPHMIAVRGWYTYWAGLKPSSSTFESGVPMDDAQSREHEIAIVNVRSGVERVLTSATADPVLDVLRVAPGGEHIAFLDLLELPATPYRASGLHRWAPASRRLVIVGVDGEVVVDAARLSTPTASFEWAADGRSFALMEPRARGDEVTIFVGTLNGDIAEVPLDGVTPKRFLWVDEKRLLVLGEPDAARAAATGATHTEAAGPEAARGEWWLVSPSEPARSVTSTLEHVPVALAGLGPGEVAGVVGGDLWRWATGSGQWLNVTASFDPKVTELVWHGEDDAQVVVRAGQLYEIDVATGAAEAITSSDVQGTFREYDPASKMAIFLGADGPETTLVAAGRASRDTLAEINQFARGIRVGEWRRLDYEDRGGDSAKAWVLLPPTYEPGRRYPVVTVVYGGRTYDDTPPASHISGVTGHSEWQVYAARGYAVLFPSMPAPELIWDGGHAADPYTALPNGVLPAIDELIAEGIADPDRLAVLGHSWGGYSTYGLITQTDRFKAAISLAGPSNLASWYGAFIPQYRYRPRSPATWWITAEEGQGAAGNPPWEDPDRYIRNSPISYAERVQTPVLILQGDMDQVPIQQGEEFFTALLRQNKRARFVRYWGEEHSISGPANVRDMIYQVLSWLDEHLDVARDRSGDLVWDRERVRSRNGGAVLNPEDFARLDALGLEPRRPGNEPD